MFRNVGILSRAFMVSLTEKVIFGQRLEGDEVVKSGIFGRIF